MKKQSMICGMFVAVWLGVPLMLAGQKTVDPAVWEQELAAMPVKAVLFPIRQAVISAEVDSQVLSYKFKEGEHFEKNALLVTMNSSSYEQRLEKAKATLSEAETAYNHAKEAYETHSKMYRDGVGGQQDMKRSELEFAVNKTRVAFNKANLKMAELDLAACNVAAPFNGRIVRKFIQEYEFVRYGTQLVSIIDDSQLLAVMHLPSADKKNLKLGQEMKIKVDETGNIHLGKVYEISAEADPASRTFEVKVVLDNMDHQLSAGWSGQLMKDAPAKKTE